jgi:hypothetical protein
MRSVVAVGFAETGETGSGGSRNRNCCPRDTTGKSPVRFEKCALVQPASRKYFYLRKSESVVGCVHPASCRGTLRPIVADVRRVAMGAKACETIAGRRVRSAVWSWRPDAGVKFVDDFHGRRWLKSPAHRGERVYAVTPSCREGRIAPVEPVVSNSCAFLTAHEAAGATSARPSLRPCFQRDDALEKTRAKRAARSRTHVRIRCRRKPIQPTLTPPPAPARSRSPSRPGCGHAFWLDRARGRSDRSCPPGTRRTGTRRRRSTR